MSTHVERRDQIVAELAALLRDDTTHVEGCGCDTVMLEPGCFGAQAHAILDYLQGAGLLWWGGRPEVASPPDNTGPLAAVRVTAEFWWPMLAADRPGWEEVGSPYVFLPAVLAVKGTAGGEVMLSDGLTAEQRQVLVPVLRQLLEKLERADG